MIAANRLLHLAARLALRVCSPLTAKSHVDALGALLPPMDIEQAEQAALHLRGGTCLSRSLALAARLPGAAVIIGLRHTAGAPLDAHAWIEIDGRTIGRGDPRPELARLR
jgi:hypothetical protein